VHTSGLPAHAPSPSTERQPVDDGIALLLDLMEPEPAPAAPPAQSIGWATRAQDWSHRAALWGAGPQGAWRAW
jgi:hypothetical protein